MGGRSVDAAQLGPASRRDLRDGRMEHAVSLVLSGTGCMASDKPGSVWAWTGAGLAHLTADDPAVPAKFAVRQVYYPEGVARARRAAGRRAAGVPRGRYDPRVAVATRRPSYARQRDTDTEE